MNRERLGAVLVGAGAVSIVFGRNPSESVLHAAVWVLAFIGVHLAFDAPKWLVAAPIIDFALGNFWSIVPDKLTPDLLSPRHAIPVDAGHVVLAAAIIAVVFHTAPRVGWGLAGYSAFAMLVGGAAQRGVAVVRSLPIAVDPKNLATDIFHVMQWCTAAGVVLAPVCWFLAAVAPIDVPPIRSRKLAMIGAMGAGIGFGLLNSLTNAEHRIGVLQAVIFFIGWVLTLVGIVGVARSNKAGIVWAGFALCVLQILVFPFMVDGLRASNDDIVVVMAMAFGMLGLAFVAFSRDLPLPRVRRVAGILFAGAMLGSCLDNCAVFVSMKDLVRIPGDPFHWWPTELARTASHWGLAVWCGYLAATSSPPANASPAR